METGPRPLIERFVSALIPPASREHVLGDLYQRNRSHGQYVLDACRVVPHVIWSQVRRTANLPLLIGEFVLVYLAFASAAVSVSGFFARPFALYQLAIPAIVALVTLVLRDAYARAKRSTSEVAADALLAVIAILGTEELLLLAGSGMALPRIVLLGGAVASLLALSTVRKLANERAAHPNREANAPMDIPAGPQKDLHRWWWLTAVLGIVAWAFLFGHQAFREFRPWLIAWLIIFVAIGIYQHRKIHWPSRTNGSLGGDPIYRAALVRQRDAQTKWPFRRVPALLAVIAVLGLLTWQEVMSGAGVPRMNVALAMYVFAVTAWLLCGWLLTNRAARDFERELAVLDSLRPKRLPFRNN